mgnify:CR=1 FL=1
MQERHKQSVTEPAESVSGLSTEFLETFRAAMGSGRIDEVQSLAKILHPADLADLLEALPSEKRKDLIDVLRQDLNPVMIAELDEAVLERVTDQLSAQEMANAIAEMETDDAVDVVEELGEQEKRDVLDALPIIERTLIEEGLSYPEDSAGRLMQRKVVSVPVHWNVGQAIDFMRAEVGLPRDFYDIFLVSPAHKPIGSIPLSRVMRRERHVALNALMIEDMKIIPGALDQEEVAFVFRQRDLVSAPVVDGSGRRGLTAHGGNVVSGGGGGRVGAPLGVLDHLAIARFEDVKVSNGMGIQHHAHQGEQCDRIPEID